MAHYFGVTHSDFSPKTVAWYTTSANGTYTIKVERHVDGVFREERRYRTSGHSGDITRLQSKTNYRFGCYFDGHWVYRTHTTK